VWVDKKRMTQLAFETGTKLAIDPKVVAAQFPNNELYAHYCIHLSHYDMMIEVDMRIVFVE